MTNLPPQIAARGRQPRQPTFVTPDLFRGPPGHTPIASASCPALAAQWTPEQVRGDGGYCGTRFGEML